MVTLAGVKWGKDTGQVFAAEVQVALRVDPSGAVTTTVTGVWLCTPVTSMTRPVQPITVQVLGLTTSHPGTTAATTTRMIANTARGRVIDPIRIERSTLASSFSSVITHRRCRTGRANASCRPRVSRGLSGLALAAI
jgi:hypothetical protein